MIKLFGPEVPRYSFEENSEGEMVTTELCGFEIEASTLGDALKLYEMKYGLKVTPYCNQISEIQFKENEEPKYFWLENTEQSEKSCVVDIHIERLSEEICAKQKLDTLLQNGDIILIGPLAC